MSTIQRESLASKLMEGPRTASSFFEDIEKRTKKVLSKPQKYFIGRDLTLVTDPSAKISFERIFFDFQAARFSMKPSPALLERVFLSLLDVAKAQKLAPRECIEIMGRGKKVLLSFGVEGKGSPRERAAKMLQTTLSLLRVAKKFMLTQAQEAYYYLKKVDVDVQRSQLPRGIIKKSNGEVFFIFDRNFAKEIITSFEALSFFTRWSVVPDSTEEGLAPALNVHSSADNLALQTAKNHKDPTVAQVARLFSVLFEGNEIIKRRNETVASITQMFALTILNPLFTSYPLFDAYCPSYPKMMRYWMQYLETSQKQSREGTWTDDLDPEEPPRRLAIYREYLDTQEVTHRSYEAFYRVLQVNGVLEGHRACLYPSSGLIEETLPTPEQFFAEGISEPIFEMEAPSKRPEDVPPPREGKEKKQRRRKHKVRQQTLTQQTPMQASSQPLVSSTPSPETSSSTQEVREKKERKVSSTEEFPAYIQQIFFSRSLPAGEQEISYDVRVLDWLEEGGQRGLSRDEYINLPSSEKTRVLETHGFTTFLDRFVGSVYSLKTTWNNPTTGRTDDLYLIPAEMECAEREPMRGIFQYTFGAEDHLCYHRYFSRRLGGMETFVTSIIERVFFDQLDYPSLQVSSQRAARRTQPFSATNAIDVIHDPVTDMITIKDLEKRMSIKLLRFGSFQPS